MHQHKARHVRCIPLAQGARAIGIATRQTTATRAIAADLEQHRIGARGLVVKALRQQHRGAQVHVAAPEGAQALGAQLHEAHVLGVARQVFLTDGLLQLQGQGPGCLRVPGHTLGRALQVA